MNKLFGLMLLFCARNALADGLCDDLVNESAKQKCKDKTAAECTSMDYWTKRHCEEAIATGMDVCGAKEFYDACESAIKVYWDVCRKAEVDWNKKDEVAEWQQRVKQVPGAKKVWQDFSAQYGSCWKSGDSKCIADRMKLQDCESAAEKYSANLVEQLDSILDSTLKDRRSLMDMFSKQKRFNNAAGVAYNFLSELHSYEKMLPDHAKLKAEIAKLDADMKVLEKTAMEQLAKVRCPAEKDPNPALRSTLRPIFAEWLEASNPDMDEKTIAFRMNGKVEVSYAKLIGTTFENARVTACIKQQEKDAKAKCRACGATLRRVKLDGGSFSAWGYYSMGCDEEMLCENLKPD